MNENTIQMIDIVELHDAQESALKIATNGNIPDGLKLVLSAANALHARRSEQMFGEIVIGRQYPFRYAIFWHVETGIG